MITAFYAAILALFLAYLYLCVVNCRRKNRIGLGDGGNDEMLRVIRIHSNFCETAPFILILMILLEMMLPQAWIIHIFGILLVLSRFLNMLGLRESPLVSNGRTFAGIITVGLLITGSLILLYMTVFTGSVFTL